jgi:ADP-ribosyl-[dinitrogen reductase] hydrolase
LLGLAVGDALGAPVEFVEQAAIARKHGRIGEMIGGGWLSLQPGQWTDETAQMLALINSLIENNGFVPDDIASRFVAWFSLEPPDVDSHTRAVLARMRGDHLPGNKGVDWKTASQGVQRLNPSAAGNGALTRCAPVALWDYDDTSARIEHCKVSSELTHAHQECQWSAAIAGEIVAELIRLGGRDAALDTAMEECRDAPGHIRKRISLAPGKTRSELKPTGYVLDTLDCALWSLMNSSSLEECIVEAVNLGGDADTTAAIAGAFAGAFYGETEIPARWLDVLFERERIASAADKIAVRHGF